MKAVLRTLLLFALRLCASLVTRSPRQSSERSPTAPPRVLLIRPGHLGDLVLVTPALTVLKAGLPEAHVTLVVASAPSPVVARHPGVDHLITCRLPSQRDRSPRSLGVLLLLLRLARVLSREHFDLVINLRARFWWGAVLFVLAGIPERIGLVSPSLTALYTQALPRVQGEHVAATCLRLLSAGLVALGASPLAEPFTPQRYPLCVTVAQEEQQWVSERLQAEGIASTETLVVIHPGAGTALKQWRVEGWAHCISALASSWPGPLPIRFLLTGSPGERALLSAVAEGTPIPTTQVTEATIGQFAALLPQASLVLGVDSGPLRLAVAQGTPTLTLFGPTDPRRYGPWGEARRHRVVAARLRCAACPALPCGRLDVPAHQLARHPCVRWISEPEVLSALTDLLLAGQGPGDATGTRFALKSDVRRSFP